MDSEQRATSVAEDPISAERLREVEAMMMRRIEAAERETERLRRRERAQWVTIAAIAGISLITVGVAAMQGNENRVVNRLQARGFVLRGPAGTERGLWEMTDDGQVRMLMRDDAGRERLRMSLLADGSPGVMLSDERGRPRAVIGTLADGTTNLVIADRRGNTRLVMGQSPADDISLVLADNAGVTRAVLGVAPDGSADFSVFRPDAAPVAAAEPVADSIAEPEAD